MDVGGLPGGGGGDEGAFGDEEAAGGGSLDVVLKVGRLRDAPDRSASRHGRQHNPATHHHINLRTTTKTELVYIDGSNVKTHKI